jgi:hypothetical protein
MRRNAMICRKCGNKVERGAKVCVACGRKIVRPDSRALATAGKVSLRNPQEAGFAEGIGLDEGTGFGDEDAGDGSPEVDGLEAALGSIGVPLEEDGANPGPAPSDVGLYPWPEPKPGKRRARKDRMLQWFFGASVFIALVLGLLGGYYYGGHKGGQGADPAAWQDGGGAGAGMGSAGQ